MSLLALAACRGPMEKPSSVSTEPAKAESAGAATEPASAADTVAPITPAILPSAEARSLVTMLRTRFKVRGQEPSGGPLLPWGLAETFSADGTGLRANFAAAATSNDRPSARVLFPSRSNNALHIEDLATGTGADIVLVGSREADAQIADGYVIYPRAHVSGATVLHRALPAGAEDYLSFESQPPAPAVAYKVTLGDKVSGLRLVANTLELLDASGAPRLRVAPPYLVGSDGVQTDAVLAVTGCAFDRSPASPWGRAVTAPGAKTCTVRVSWDGDAVEYPAVLDPRWTTTTSAMVAARQDHTATLLSTGKVLVAGGRASSTSTTGLATAELFDRTTGTWAATASMTGGRWSHSAVQLDTSSNTTTSSNILIAGGINGTTSQNTAQLYSPSAGTWLAAANLNVARHQHTATLLSNGQVLLAGGLGGTTVLNTAALYNPASGTGTWTATGNMASARRAHTATLLAVAGNATLHNKVLVVGGNSGGTTSLTSVQLFDGTTWSTPTGVALATAREGHTATTLANGNLLITGGKNGSTTLGTTFLFTATSGSGSWASAGTMTSVRQAHSATLLATATVANGQVLVTGGSSGTASLATTELWNGATTWTTSTALPAAVQGHTATLLTNNAVLIAGGGNGATAASTARIYDPSFALACTSNSQCTTGFCANGVCCDTACTTDCAACNLAGLVGTCSPKANNTVCPDDGNACTTDKCNGTSQACQHAAGNAGATCRAVVGTCDVAEQCNGTSTTCPTDTFLAATNVCRASVGTCDVIEKCTGTSGTCPTDAFVSSGTVCRAPGAPCDAQENCTGSSGTCPADAQKAPGAVCDDGNACTSPDTCQSGTCTAGTAVACQGSGATSSGAITSAGGTITRDQAKVQVPSGALTTTKTLTITASSKQPPAGLIAYSPIFDFGPDGTQFAVPVTVTFTVGFGLSRPSIIWSRPNGVGYDEIGGTYANGVISAQVTHFSSGGVVQSQCQGQENGTACTDGNACTSSVVHGAVNNDVCSAGKCVAGAAIDCTTGNACRPNGTCNPSTGFCSSPPPVANGTPCDDANSCTGEGSCQAGACLPGVDTPTCAAPSGIYLKVVNLGSTQGQTIARGINNGGVVVGSDTVGHTNATVAALGGNIPSKAFRWSESTGMTYLPSLGLDTFAQGINDAGTVVGIAGYDSNDWLHAFVHTPSASTLQVVAPGWGTAINSSGQAAGFAYFPPGLMMFRATGAILETSQGMPADRFTINQSAADIDEQGNVIGYVPRTHGGSSAARFTVAGVTQDLNDFLPPPVHAGDPLWDLQGAGAIHKKGTNPADTDQYIVGWGRLAGVGRAFRMTVNGSGMGTEIADLGMVAPTPSDTYPYVPNAHDVNAKGEVAGSLHLNNDGDGGWPAYAFIWVPGTGMTILDTLVDTTHWHLVDAHGINDNRQVVGWGYYDGQARAFKVQLPDMSPCDAPADACQTRPLRDLRTGECPSAVPLADGTACISPDTVCAANNVCYQGVCGGGFGTAICLEAPGVVQLDGHLVAVLGYENVAPSIVHPTRNEVRINGNIVATPNPAPPRAFLPGVHHGAFLPSIAGGQILTWQVQGQRVSIAANASQFTPQNGPDGDLIIHVGNDTVPIKRNLDRFKIPKTPPSPNAGPDLGDDFEGTLVGRLEVGPSGAATYSLPISIPPGIAGMAPNLSLTYSSQGGNGIAGQGWELGGLSAVHRCQQTIPVDGVSFPILNIDLVDQLCLDGKRLVERNGSRTSFFSESKDFSSITATSSERKTIKVVTKAGETRYYGLRSGARVALRQESSSKEIVIWALDRVMDTWGNYFDIYYNEGLEDFKTKGLRVSRIEYTGNLTSASGPPTSPFYAIQFDYDSTPRLDSRETRFGAETIPRNGRLNKIRIGTMEGVALTPLRTYELRYLPIDTVHPTADDLMLPSRLAGIKYCSFETDSTAGACLEEITFDWEGGGYRWEENTAYALPERLFRDPNGLNDSALIDLDADGLTDFLTANGVWRNTGNGWEKRADWFLPAPLLKGGAPNAVFADMDGDGDPDLVSNVEPISGLTCTVSQDPNTGDTACSDGCNLIGGGDGQPLDCAPSVWGPAVWINRIKSDKGWAFSPTLSVQSSTGVNVKYSNFLDMDGDGRADWITYGPGQWELSVFRNIGAGWQRIPGLSYPNINTANNGTIRDFNFEDINRDGIADLVLTRNPRTYLGSTTFLNKGGIWDAPTRGEFPSDPNSKYDPINRAIGDVDGDGIRDSVVVKAPDILSDCDAEAVCGPLYIAGINSPIVSIASGGRWWIEEHDWAAAAGRYGVKSGAIDPNIPLESFHDYYFAMADLNSDGMADLILNHFDGGQLLINRTQSWKDLNGETAFTMSAGPIQSQTLPIVPRPGISINVTGAFFVDLNGDGVTDLTQYARCQDQPGRAKCKTTGDAWERRAWINKFQPPTIRKFPNGLAKKTEVTYRILTTADGKQIYSDNPDVDEGLSYLTTPLRVVSSLASDNGLGSGALLTTSYQYGSLRAAAGGRGPQGFHDITVVDPTGLKTITTFAQTYPYTGLPTSVVRSRRVGSGPVGTILVDKTLAETHTTYCDNFLGVLCRPMSGAGSGTPYTRPTTSDLVPFVYPLNVIETTHIWSSRLPVGPQPPDAFIKTTTFTKYDDAGNPTYIEVVMASSKGEEVKKETTNEYVGTRQRNEGKLTKSTVKSTQTKPVDLNPDSITHTTEFKYKEINPFTPPSDTARKTLALDKVMVEPRTPLLPVASPNVVELHTAYAYDRFGHVITTTSCANNFSQCEAGVVRPSPSGTPLKDHSQFRTTEVSYERAAFASTSSGPGVLTSVPYGDGRFPVRTKNSAGHFEYTIYDPDRGGGLRQQTGPNGVTSCRTYSIFGRLTSETARCGSALPVKTTMHLHRNNLFPASSIYPTVSVTRPDDGAYSWSYSDVLGRTGQTVARTTDGGLSRAEIIYDSFGRVGVETKPHLDQTSAPIYTTVHGYDDLGRPISVTQDLGRIDDFDTNAKTIVLTTYAGFSVTSEHTEGGHRSHRRTETKNVFGKTASVIDSDDTTVRPDGTTGNEIQFWYDADGNLSMTKDPANNYVTLAYDVRGRRTGAIDSDLGSWSYHYDGFGEMLTQEGPLGTTTMTYDVLGRMTAKSDASGTSLWLYDGAPGRGLGKLAAMVGPADTRLRGPCSIEGVSNLTGNHAGRWFHYNDLGDVEESFECTDGDTFSMKMTYDVLGRPSVIQYPSVAGTRLSVQNAYDLVGNLVAITDVTDGNLLWEAVERNVLGQVTKEYLRNGVETVSNRNTSTGWLLGSTSHARADRDTLIQGWTYSYDEVGNLTGRVRSDQVNATSSFETFTYDALDRLHRFDLFRSSGEQSSDVYTYDTIGNITRKNDKVYTYGNCGGGPHAVCAVGAGTPFVYDNVGSMTSGNGRNIIYDLQSRPTHIDKTASAVDFIYGSDGQRVVQETTNGGSTARTVYVSLGANGRSMYERTTRDGIHEHTHFIFAGGTHNGNAFALRVVTTTSDDSSVMSEATRYYHFDHLGSVTAVSDESGRVQASPGGPNAGVMDYDPWGAKRSPDEVAPSAATGTVVGHREFTGHETIPNIGLVNMNGRVYDPDLGRFLSADPNVQFVADLQSYNRYSYVLNNPLRYTDPTGYLSVETVADWAMAIGTAIQIGLVCAGTEGVGCAVAIGIVLTAFQAAAMASQGASYEATAGFVTASLVSMGVPSMGNSLTGVMVRGAISAVISTTISAMVSGSSLDGGDLVKTAGLAAFNSAVIWGVGTGIAVSKASAAKAQGGGAVGSSGGQTTSSAEPGQDGGNKTATAHLLSRPIDRSQLSWWQRAVIWATGASHAGWVIETGDGSYLIEAGCPKCTPQGGGGEIQASVSTFKTAEAAYKAFGTDQYGNRVSVHDHGSLTINVSDFQGVVDRFNAMGTTYNYASTNSNYFSHWFSTQAGIPITTDPTGSAFLPGPWLYQWNYSPPGDGVRR